VDARLRTARRRTGTRRHARPRWGRSRGVGIEGVTSERIPLLSEIVRTPARSARGKRPVTRPMPSRRCALFFLRSSHSVRNRVLTLDQSALCAPIGDSHHTNIGNLRLAPYNRHWDTTLRTQRSALQLATKLNNVVIVSALQRCHRVCAATSARSCKFSTYTLNASGR
jgi:hypothetical protein